MTDFDIKHSLSSEITDITKPIPCNSDLINNIYLKTRTTKHYSFELAHKTCIGALFKSFILIICHTWVHSDEDAAGGYQVYQRSLKGKLLEPLSQGRQD